MAPSVLGPRLGSNLASFLGREPDPTEKSMAPVEGTPGFLIRCKQRSLWGNVHSWLCSWQEWLGVGGWDDTSD